MLNPLLKVIADDPALLKALKELLYSEFEVDYVSGADANKSNEDLGAVLRARLEGLRKVDSAFKKILQIKNPTENVDKKNPAR